MLPNFADQHADSKSTGESPITAIGSASWVKVLGTAYTPRVRHQNCSLGVPACNPKPQTDININFPANCSSCFMLIFFFFFLIQYCLFCFVDLGMLLIPWHGWPDILQALNNSKIHSLSYLWCCQVCTRSRKQSGQCPGRSEARPEACSAFLSLNTEHATFI